MCVCAREERQEGKESYPDQKFIFFHIIYTSKLSFKNAQAAHTRQKRHLNQSKDRHERHKLFFKLWTTFGTDVRSQLSVRTENTYRKYRTAATISENLLLSVLPKKSIKWVYFYFIFYITESTHGGLFKSTDFLKAHNKGNLSAYYSPRHARNC